MSGFKKLLIIAILILVAFGVGYGWGYVKLKKAEKEWIASQETMQSKITALQNELALAKARESFWETPLILAQISRNISDKNFGLATQSLDQLKENFSKGLAALPADWRGRFAFFLPALDEIRADVQNMNPNVTKKVEDLQSRFEQSLRSTKGG